MPPAKKATKATTRAAAREETPKGKTAKAAALSRFETDFDKSFGAGKLKKGGVPVAYEVISTGSLDLDLATTVGGYVRGRIHEMWGVDALGKSTLVMLAIVEAQKAYPDEACAWIDAEQTWDDKWAVEHGVDLERLYRFAPDNAEDVADAVKKMAKSGAFSLVVVDSVGAMIPQIEREKMSDEEVVGKQAKIVTRMVKVNAVEASRSNTAIMLINQVRANIGAYGADKQTGGGWALKHGTTMKFLLSRTGTEAYAITVGGNKIVVGHELAVKLERNKVGPSQRRALVSMFFVPSGKFGPIGIDKADEASRLGVRQGVIKQAGAWYTTPDGEKFNGLDKVIAYLREHPELVLDIRNRIIESVQGQVVEDDLVEASA